MANIIDQFERFNNNIFFERADYSNVEFEKCKDGNFTFKIEKDGKIVYAHSKYNPIREAEKYFNEIEMVKDSVFIIFGFGLGHFLRKMLEKSSMRNFFFVYEPNVDVFTKIIDEGYCNDIFENPNLYVVSSKNIQPFEIIIKDLIDANMYMRCKTTIIPTYKDIYNEQCVEFLKSTMAMIDNNIIKRNTVYSNREKWSIRPFENTETVLNSYSSSQLYNLFKGGTAIIVAAGPSLKKNMHLLKEAKGKIPIISVFVAAKVLLANGITPDFIVSIDTNQSNMTEGMYDHIPLFYDSRVSKEFINSHKGINIAITSNTNRYYLNLLEKYNKKIVTISGGGSVACDSVSIADNFGCKNIILIGQDLAYTDNMCHVDGTDHKEKTAEDVNRELIEIPAVGGGTVFTDSVFKYYIEWFEAFGLAKKDEINLIDATEGGALMKNTTVMTLKEAIEKYMPETNSSEIISNFFENNETAFSEEEKAKVFEDLDKEFELVNDILKDISEEEELFEKYIKALKFSSNIKSIMKIEKSLDDYDDKINKSKEKIKLLMGIATYISEARKFKNGVNRILEENDVLDSAYRRKNWLLELKEGLEFVRDLRKVKENE